MPFGSGDLGMGISMTIIDKFSQPSNTISNSFNRMDKNVTKSSMNMQDSIGKIGVAFAGVLAAGALVAPFVAAVKISSEFNASISKVGAISRATADDIDRMRLSAIDLGSQTKFSATQAADGMSFLAMAGFETNEILSAMPGLLDLAAAGNTDLAATADIASNILSAMGLEASEMNRVADVLAATSTRANVSVMQLGESFKFAAPAAAQLGISLEETSALVGMLGDIGIQGSLAGTTIQNFGAAMAKIDDKKLSNLGLTMQDISDQEGNMLSITKIFPKIIDSVKGMGTLEGAGVLIDIFGLRGQKAISAALADGVKDLGKFTEILEGSSGEAARIAAQMLDNFEGDLITLGSVWESLMINLGTPIESALRPLVQFASTIVGFISDFLATNTGKVVAGILAITASIGALIIAGSALAPLLATVGGMIFAVTGVTLAAAAPFIAVGVAIAAVFFFLEKSVSSFDETIGKVANGNLGFFEKIFLQIGGVIRGVIEIFKSATMEGFSMSEGLANSLENIGILDFVLVLGTWIVRIKAFFVGMMSGFSRVGSVIKGSFGKLFSAFGKILDLFPDMGLGLGKLGGEVSGFAMAGEFLAEVIGGTLMFAIEALSFSIGALIGIFSFAIEMTSLFWGGLIDVFQGDISFFEFGVNLVTGIWEGIKSAWSFIVEGMTGLINALPFGDKILNLISGEDEGNLSVTNQAGGGAGINNIGNTIAETAGENAKPNSQVISNTTEKVVSQETVVHLDGEEIYRNMKDREQLEADRN